MKSLKLYFVLNLLKLLVFRIFYICKFLKLVKIMWNLEQQNLYVSNVECMYVYMYVCMEQNVNRNRFLGQINLYDKYTIYI